MRRGSFQAGTVDYAAVGATGAADLMGYPPAGTIPAEQSWRIGSGQERFDASADALLSWVPLRGAGLTLSDVTPAAGPSYAGVSFDADGNAIAPTRSDGDLRFDAEGTPYVTAGTSLEVSGRVGGHNADAKLRVIAVEEAPRRVGFTIGTVDGSVVSGEEAFTVEWRDNDQVWFTVRAFERGHAGLYRVFAGMVRRRRKALFQAYLRAVSPLYTSSD